MTFLVSYQGSVYEKDLRPEHRERRSRHDGIQPGQDLARGHRCDPISHGSQMKKFISVDIAE